MPRTPKAQDAPQVGRPTKYDPAYCRQLIDHMSEGASMLSFAAEIEVCRDTLSEWAKVHPEFSAAVTRGKAKCAAWWEKVGRNLAMTGEGNATMVVFGLKNMGAGEWADRTGVDHTSSDGSMSPAPITGFEVSIARAPQSNAD